MGGGVLEDRRGLVYGTARATWLGVGLLVLVLVRAGDGLRCATKRLLLGDPQEEAKKGRRPLNRCWSVEGEELSTTGRVGGADIKRQVRRKKERAASTVKNLTGRIIGLYRPRFC